MTEDDFLSRYGDSSDKRRERLIEIFESLPPEAIEAMEEELKTL